MARLPTKPATKLEKPKTGLVIPKNWTFESNQVATNFEQHVREQLPWYDLATRCVAHLAHHYIPEKGKVYDLGASTGNIARAIADTLEVRQAQLTAIEASAEMLNQYSGDGVAINAKVENYSYQPFDVAIAFLTLQFVIPSERPGLIERLKQTVRKGGALIILDKFASSSGYLGTALYKLTLRQKLELGTPPDKIIQKELSLVGVQRPLDPDDYQDWKPFFQFGDFKGLIWEK